MVTRTKLSYLYSIAVSAMLIFAAVIASSFLSFSGNDVESFITELYSNALILILIGIIAAIAVISLGFSSMITQSERSNCDLCSRLDAIEHQLEKMNEPDEDAKKD
jgi:hypothetical protein